MEENLELALYRLITEEDLVSEFGWCTDGSFLVWVDYWSVKEFMDKAICIFGYGMFDDGSFDANMQSDGICIDLRKMLESYLDIEDVFPKEKYKH